MHISDGDNAAITYDRENTLIKLKRRKTKSVQLNLSSRTTYPTSVTAWEADETLCSRNSHAVITIGSANKTYRRKNVMCSLLKRRRRHLIANNCIEDLVTIVSMQGN